MVSGYIGLLSLRLTITGGITMISIFTRGWLVASCSALLFAFSSIANAETFTVTQPFGDGMGSLPSAIESAEDGDTIVFDLANPLQPIVLNRQIFIDKSITIDGGEDRNVVIQTFGNRHFVIGEEMEQEPPQDDTRELIDGMAEPAALTVTIRNLGFSSRNRLIRPIVANNTKSAAESALVVELPFIPDDYGGAIFVSEGTQLTLVSSSFSGIRGAEQGGAVFSRGRLLVQGSSFVGNQSNDGGGAIDSRGELEIADSFFFANRSDEGGAINAQTDEWTVITNTEFANNTSDNFGGAVRQSRGSLTVNRSSFTFNRTSSNSQGYGGAIHAESDLELQNNTFFANSSTVGGAVSYANVGIVSPDLPTSDSAQNGSEAYTVLLNHNTFSQNRANVVFEFKTETQSRLTFGASPSSTLSIATGVVNDDQVDTAQVGGPSTTVTLQNNIYSGSGSQPLCFISSLSTTSQNSFATDASCGVAENNVVSEDELRLQDFPLDNGCVTPIDGVFGSRCVSTLALQEDSIAINTGFGTGAETVDQRELLRSTAGLPDVGAFERPILDCATSPLFVGDSYEFHAAVACYNESEQGTTFTQIEQDFELPGVGPVAFNRASDTRNPENPDLERPNLVISGEEFTIDSVGSGRHLNVGRNAEVTMSQVTLTGGAGFINGGSILVGDPEGFLVNSLAEPQDTAQGRFSSFAELTLNEVTFDDNQVSTPDFLSGQFDIVLASANDNQVLNDQSFGFIGIPDGSANFGSGGAIAANFGDVFIQSSLFTNNRAVNGGAISSNNRNGRTFFRISDSQFVGNSARADFESSVFARPFDERDTSSGTPFEGEIIGQGEGGAIFNAGTFMVIRNTSFIENSATMTFGRVGGNGGAILNGGEISMDQSSFSGNTALFELDSPFAEPIPEQSPFGEPVDGVPSAGFRINGSGGALMNVGFLGMQNTTISANSATYIQPIEDVIGFGSIGDPVPGSGTFFGVGGGLANFGFAETNNITVANNSSSVLGFLLDTGPQGKGASDIANIAIDDGEIPRESFPTVGSALFSGQLPGFDNNLGGPGVPRSQLEVYDSIISGDSGIACANPSSIDFAAGNFTDNESCALGSGITLSDSINLGLLTDNGCVEPQLGIEGPTCGLSHDLLQGSVAVDARAETELFPSVFLEFDGEGPEQGTLVDQRGFERPQGDLFDAGAIEVTDNDFDGVPNDEDNCIVNPNPDQMDFEGDGIGDVCDDDIDGDGMPNDFETANGLNPRNSLDRDGDLDRDGFTNFEEFEFGSNPGVADTDNNQNNVPDSVDRRINTIPSIIQLLLLDDSDS